jgi:hypothetical protein
MDQQPTFEINYFFFESFKIQCWRVSPNPFCIILYPNLYFQILDDVRLHAAFSKNVFSFCKFVRRSRHAEDYQHVVAMIVHAGWRIPFSIMSVSEDGVGSSPQAVATGWLLLWTSLEGAHFRLGGGKGNFGFPRWRGIRFFRSNDGQVNERVEHNLLTKKWWNRIHLLFDIS